MTSALNPIRALFVAVVCFAALAAWAPFASAQEVVPGAGDTVVVPDPPPPPPVDPPPVDPPVDQAPPPPADPAPVDPPPADPAPVDPAPVDPVPLEPAGDRNPPARDDASRSDAARTPTFTAPQNAAATTVPSDAFTTPAQLPPAGPGEDFALTGKGDAFIFGSGGSSGGGGPTALLASFSRFGSIATAAARVPALGGRERAARDAARANASSSGIVMVHDSGSTGLFWKMFGGGGGGGGAAMMMLTVLGLLAVVRLLPPEALKNFLISTAVWRPSAYVPPIEHPG